MASPFAYASVRFRLFATICSCSEFPGFAPWTLSRECDVQILRTLLPFAWHGHVFSCRFCEISSGLGFISRLFWTVMPLKKRARSGSRRMACGASPVCLLPPCTPSYPPRDCRGRTVSRCPPGGIHRIFTLSPICYAIVRGWPDSSTGGQHRCCIIAHHCRYLHSHHRSPAVRFHVRLLPAATHHSR